MTKTVLSLGIMPLLTCGACSNDATATTPTTTTLHKAFAEFDKTNFTITLSGDKVIIKTNGRPKPHFAILV